MLRIYGFGIVTAYFFDHSELIFFQYKYCNDIEVETKPSSPEFLLAPIFASTSFVDIPVIVGLIGAYWYGARK